MKMLKNIVRLVALLSLSLSVTPLTTAKAATNKAIQVTNDANKLDVAYSSNTLSATPTAATTDATTVTAGEDAHSTVSVNVLSGILTLEAVPNFNFGSMMQGTTGKLQGNTVDTTGYNSTDKTKPITAGEDGNDSGLLEVIDSRNDLKDMPGFTLTASMGKLKSIDSDTSTADLRAILHLSSLPLLDGDNNNISTTSDNLNTLASTTDSGDDTHDATTASIIDLAKGSYNAGVIKANFTGADDASLNIPGSGDNSKESAKKMNSVITWTLTAKPTVTSN
ncbi:WxL domain-containing protein [Companilactobacillus kimchiensis]|uniref:WxL domain-containing protein n=1 Tax=Companilactobacillus kimchiensis TaxID=993692 RepID=A0A0R2LIJ7_9LACO|nr:WxL domain-containing protein [Companilactobacillus kimchiensis]KRN99894.1 hypothetical protein IV57_GL002226 [Companilactobacillus kimchiensis]